MVDNNFDDLAHLRAEIAKLTKENEHLKNLLAVSLVRLDDEAKQFVKQDCAEDLTQLKLDL